MNSEKDEKDREELKNFYYDYKDLLKEDGIMDIEKITNNKKDNQDTEVNNDPKQFNNINYVRSRIMNIEKEDDNINNNFSGIENNNNNNNQNGKPNIEIVIPIQESIRELTNVKKKEINPKYTREYTKKRKVPYGDWIVYYKNNKNNLERKMPRINNKFINNHKIGKDILTYFSIDAPKFLSERAKELKLDIVDYGQTIINESIKDEEKLLYYISYEEFCKPLQKDFTKPNYDKKLGDIFIEYQENRNIEFIDNNKNVIKYIRDHEKDEEEANKLLNLSFYKLCQEFFKNYFKEYLQERKKELISSYENEIGETPCAELIKAYSNVMEILCENFEKYSTSETKRKVDRKKPKKINKFSIRRLPKKKKKKCKN